MKNLFFILAMVLLSACANESKKSANVIMPTPNGLQDLQGAAPQNASNNTSSSSDSGLQVNPAHGLPGHDCSIAVGAPLKSATNNTPVQTQAPTAAPTTVVTPVAPAETKPAANSNAKLNPAHGLPGHDCSIAVGAPLNSKKTTAAAPVVSSPQVIQNQNSEASNSPKINPEHGKAGHRCDIAVGAALT